VERSYVIKKLIDRRFRFGLLVFRTEAKYFDLVCLLSELKQNVFNLVCLLSQLKQNILIWSAYYRNESKTF
jgi:hypothetical protein